MSHSPLNFSDDPTTTQLYYVPSATLSRHGAKRSDQDRDVAVAVNPAELLLCDLEARRGPALDHLAITPALDIAHHRSGD